jgi:hypothetical protein
MFVCGKFLRRITSKAVLISGTTVSLICAHLYFLVLYYTLYACCCVVRDLIPYFPKIAHLEYKPHS